MDPRIGGYCCDCAPPIFGGIYLTLLAFRVVGKKPGEDVAYDDYHRKWLVWGKWLGPFLIAITFLRVILQLSI